MNEGVNFWLAVATIVLGGGGTVSIIRLFLERRKPALDARAVEVATAGDSVGMSLELATTAMEQMRDFRNQFKELQDEMSETTQRAKDAERRAERAEERATHAERGLELFFVWAEHLIQNWAEVRLSETPPKLPDVPRLGTPRGR